MNRTFVYGNSKQSHIKAMLLYFAIAFVWFWFTVGTTVFLAHQFHIQAHVGHFVVTELFVARTAEGIFVGIFGFIVSSLVTFKVPREAK